MNRRKIITHASKSVLVSTIALACPYISAAQTTKTLAKVKLFLPERLISDEFFTKFYELTKIEVERLYYANFRNLNERIFNFIEGDLDLVILPSEYVYALADLGFTRPLLKDNLVETAMYPEFNNFEGIIYKNTKHAALFGFDAYGAVFDLTQFPISRKTNLATLIDSSWDNSYAIANDPLVVFGLLAQIQGVKANYDWDDATWEKMQVGITKFFKNTIHKGLKVEAAEELMFQAKVKLTLGIGQSSVADLIKRKRKAFNYIGDAGGMVRGIALTVSKYTRQEEFCNIFITTMNSARVQSLLFQDSYFRYNPINKVFWNKLTESGQDVVLWRGMADNALQSNILSLMQKGQLSPVIYPRNPSRLKIDEYWKTLTQNKT